MADSTVATGDAVTAEQFMSDTFMQYRDKLVLRPFMGAGPEFPIHVNQNLNKMRGDAITFNLVGALTGSGVTGASTLEGNEEQQNYYGQRLVIDQLRNAVRVPWTSEMRTMFDQMAAGRGNLTTWLAQEIENDFFQQMSAIITGAATQVLYGAASEAQKDQWSDDNEDRVLYGAATSNLDGSGGSGSSGNDNSDSLLTIDTTNDQLTTNQISLAKRLAQLADPKIRPIRIEGGEEYYVMFAHNYCIRDLKNSTAWQQAQREAMQRGRNNPIFTGMAGIWDGVIVKESPKVLLLSGVGASTSDVAMNSLCGAQAMLFAQGATPGGFVVDMVREDFDYGDKKGVAIRSVHEISKARFITNDTNPCQHGIVTVFSSAAAD